MSSDSDFEPTPPKRRRHAQLMSRTNDSGSPLVTTLRNEQTNKHGGEYDDVFVLTDNESDAHGSRGSTSYGTNTDSESPSIANLPLDRIAKTSKESSESIKSVAQEKAAGSSTGIESDTNDAEAEKCPICWLPFTNQEVANPSTCDHHFCLHCIMEWSKTTNTCPVDRQTFNDINVRPKFGSNVTRLIPVQSREITETDMDSEYAELDSEPDGFEYYGSDESPPTEEQMELIDRVNESLGALGTSYFMRDAEDHESLGMFSSSNENSMNPEVVVVSSSSEEMHLSSSSEYNASSAASSPNNELSESFSRNHELYFIDNLSTSSCSHSRSPPSLVSRSSPSFPSPLHSPSISPAPPPSPLPSPSPSPSIISSSSSSPSILSSPTRSPPSSSLSPSLTGSYSRSDSCSSLSNASSASISSCCL